jgi:hypothetical protein
MVDFITEELPEEGRGAVDPDFMTLFPSPDGMMHDECMVGIGGTPAHWYPADRDVPVDAILHPTVYERLALRVCVIIRATENTALRRCGITTRRRNISRKNSNPSCRLRAGLGTRHERMARRRRTRPATVQSANGVQQCERP